MNQEVNSFDTRVAKWIGGILFAVAVVVLLGLNFRDYLAVRALQQTRDELRQMENEEVKELDELTELAELADEAQEESTRNRDTLLSMYSQCLTTDDFFVVHPELVASVRVLEEDGYGCLLYLPPGQFTLEIELSSVRLGSVDVRSSEPPLVRPTVWEYALDGGRTYQVGIRLDDRIRSDDDKQETARLRAMVSGQAERSFTLPACQILLSKEKVIGGVLLPPHHLVGQQARADMKIVDAGFVVGRRGEKQESEISIRVTLHSQGAARLHATDPNLLRSLLHRAPRAAGASGDVAASLKYNDGWYELPEAELRP